MFAKYFPTVAWLWRRVTSRPARRVALFLCLALAFAAVGLHVNSAIFAHRVHRILAGLEQLRPDQTGKGEMLRLLPDLRPGLLKYEHCRGDACYATVIHNWPDSLLARLMSKIWAIQAICRWSIRRQERASAWAVGAKVSTETLGKLQFS